ncbi:hypothetical protein FM106_09010 [Brachybacterium faecium]|nr:hypothetical protein FM106_09010 [Brachybacterium faecium]
MLYKHFTQKGVLKTTKFVIVLKSTKEKDNYVTKKALST